MIEFDRPSQQFRLLLSTSQRLFRKIDPTRNRLTLRARSLYWLNSATQSVLYEIQKKSFQHELDHIAPETPIFVLGFWRSGTTFLHELLCCDLRFGFPSTYACLNPAHFLLSRRWVIPKDEHQVRRPMDDLRYSWNSPQEDEFALFLLGAPSAYEALMVPSLMQNVERLLDLDKRSAEDQELWWNTFEYLLRLLTLEQKKAMVLKSPTHGFRMGTLQRRFEHARYVVIERNPYEVFASNLKLWRTLVDRYGLERCSDIQLEQFVLASYTLHQQKVWEGTERSRAGCVAEVRYEDLVKNPIEQISRIYSKLDLGDFSAVLPRLEEHLASVASHQRNRLRLSRSQKEKIDSLWGEIIHRRGYAWPEETVEIYDA